MRYEDVLNNTKGWLRSLQSAYGLRTRAGFPITVRTPILHQTASHTSYRTLLPAECVWPESQGGLLHHCAHTLCCMKLHAILQPALAPCRAPVA